MVVVVGFVACDLGGPNLCRRALVRRRRSRWGCCGGSFPDRGMVVCCQVRWERAASFLLWLGLKVFARWLASRPSSGRFRVEDVEGAVADLARDGQSRAAAAAALDSARVERVVGTGVAVSVLRRLDERPAQMA
jgi:hypothetical protein